MEVEALVERVRVTPRSVNVVSVRAVVATTLDICARDNGSQ
jgi:hypothetical protein